MKYAALSAMLLCGVALAAQDGVLLRRELKQGMVEKYKMDMKMSMTMELPGMGEQEMETTTAANYDIKTTRVDEEKGVAVIEATTTVTKMDADGMMAGAMSGQKLPPPMVVTGTLDRRNQMKMTMPKDQGMMSDLMGSASGAMNATMIELPEKAVKIGDTWQVTVPKGPMMKKDQFMTATLKGQKEFEGRSVWIVSVEGKIKLEMDPKPMPKDAGGGTPNPLAGQKMGLKADINMKTEGLLDKVNCQMVRLESKANTTQQVEFPEIGMKMDSTSTMTTLLTLVK